jgi:hypothetical protein
MAERQKERIVESEGTLPDGREVKRPVEVERIVAEPTEVRAGTTGQGVSMMLLVSVVVAILAMAAIWYYFFA